MDIFGDVYTQFNGQLLVESVLWDNADPENPTLTLNNDANGKIRSGAYVKFINGAIKDRNGNIVRRTARR